MIKIADRLFLPADTKAVLWDMDGVLLNTLDLDLTICNVLLNQFFSEQTEGEILLPASFIRSIFAHHPKEFWKLIFDYTKKEYGITITENQLERLLIKYNEERIKSDFEINPGINEILDELANSSLKTAVISNNTTSDVKKILRQSGIFDYFAEDRVIGNDIRNLKKKPAPDTYLLAAEILLVKPEECVVIEDSLLGAQAGHKAKCFTIGVATGGTDFNTLQQSAWTDQTFLAFKPGRIKMEFGPVQKKKIVTPNEFVSHMIEHIAWRLGCEIQLEWYHDDWFLLGETVGRSVRRFDLRREVGFALGMIDDGSSEVLLEIADDPQLILESTALVDLDWFLSLRCEQMRSGRELVDLLRGLAQGLKARILIRLCSLEDPHHSWEGVFRSVGIALSQIFSPQNSRQEIENTQMSHTRKNIARGEIKVNALSPTFAEVARMTAESYVIITVDFSKKKPNLFTFKTSSSINVQPLGELLAKLAEAAGFTMQVSYQAEVLSSSHVVLEDTALVLGRALKEILVSRMELFGTNGAGSSLRTVDDFENQPIRVGLSVEGRKFVKFMPFQASFEEVRKKFIIGHNVCDGLFSEDLDDFLDGLAGGFGCSIVVHFKELIEPDQGWQMLFANLGLAINQAFAVNQFRKGVPPGVKATLA